MSKVCIITGKSSQIGGKYSNRIRATQFNPTVKKGNLRRKANLHSKKIYVPELNDGKGKTIRIIVSAKGMKTINKNGAYRALKKAGAIKKFL